MNRAALLGVFASLAVAMAAALVGTGTQSASADGGPHIVESGATPDKCAGCHRIHTGENDFLLKDAGTIEDFCYSCHGTGGSGSDLDVQDGQKRSNGGALRGGGFDFASINTTDPSLDSIGVLGTAQPVTSWHTIDGTTAGTLWGNGALGTAGAGPSYTLECTSCHDPHGNGQFRILRPIPTGSGAAAASVTDQPAPKNYGVSNHLSMGGDVSLAQISTWCATCHTRYLASSTAATADTIYTNRHRSDGNSNRACITCHASHGTNAQMPGGATGTTYSSTVEWPGGGSGTTDDNNSRLLKMDNRGICIKCHWGY